MNDLLAQAIAGHGACFGRFGMPLRLLQASVLG